MRREALAWPPWGWGLSHFGGFSCVPEEGAEEPGYFCVYPCYRRSIEAHPLPQAFMGLGRLQELVGDYGGAAESYGRALRLAPRNPVGQTAKARAERLGALVREMEALLPSGRRVLRIYTHPNWSEGNTTYHIAVTGRWRMSVLLHPEAAAIILFERRAERLRKADEVGISPARPEALWSRAAYVDLVSSDHGRSAALAVLARVAPQAGPSDFHLTLYAVRDGALVRTLELPSAEVPYVTDLDDDGEPELVTWQWAVYYPQYRGGSVLWPIVRTRVDGRYVVRTSQFPSLFGPVARALRWEGAYAPRDPKVSDRLGQAYEILGERKLAVAAYMRAEDKYLAAADQAAKKGRAKQARAHRDAAAAVRSRRLQLEAELTASGRRAGSG